MNIENMTSAQIISTLKTQIPNLNSFYDDWKIEERIKSELPESTPFRGDATDDNIVNAFMEMVWDDPMRRCSNCGNLMDAGYLLNDEYACSDECRNAIYKSEYDVDTDEEAEALYLKECNGGEGECFYTEWY